jgi:co-chaperonin GroES (HSP10)
MKAKNKKRSTKLTPKQNTALSLPRSYASVRVKASIGGKSASELQQQLADLCINIYLSGGERFIPLQPFILVRVLPKDMVSEGGIVLPNERQNKPVHEGIVLETYRPYEEEVVLTEKWTDKRGNECSEEYIGILHRECPLQVGQRIAYPHYEGVPHKYLGDDYVLVRQSADQIKFPYCQVLGTLDNEGDRKISNKIRDLLRQYYSVTTSGASSSRGANPKEEAA